MKSIKYSLIAFATLTFDQTLAQVIGIEDDIESYVSKCKTELELSKIPNIPCFENTELVSVSGNGSAQAAYFGKLDLPEHFDSAFFCGMFRPLKNNKSNTIEMWIHNRNNGNTCFFVTNTKSSANEFVPYPNNSPDNDETQHLWKSSWEIANDRNCVECHTNGPSLISRDFVKGAHRFGLVNNLRDQHLEKYNVVGDGLDIINITRNEFSPQDKSCATGCHTLAGFWDLNGGIWQFNDDNMKEIISVTQMPPAKDSDYQWINAESPNASGDWETLSRSISNYEKTVGCNKKPKRIEAKIVGYDGITYEPIPNVRQFTATKGLTCKHDDYPGSCPNFSVYFLCDEGWTNAIDEDSPDSTGDHERPPANCTNPKLAMTTINGKAYYAPAQKLYRFSASTGLVCRHVDQSNGEKCHDYQVRYQCN